MEDRYEIKGKIAQGGLGSVYKAHDVRMSRDVAIKRILTNNGDTCITDEATRQLIKEASALASLQHPNIVTIYDVGKDEEGPFVVMELLSGQTLEEIITQASFTWEDFRQLAMQSLEALIAAQELHIVHRDIKPGNIMLTWLPSGKFQVKVVDFGLAKLSAKPSLQTIDQSDGVFGSIYFMGPEQFERIPIDQRVDLYALGCVFYYALTGTYAFDGDNAVQVMASHLQHHVVPIEEVRAGIPLWACNWIMWLINRQPADRPESARDALHVFMQNDSAYIAPELSTGAPAPVVAQVETSKRPKLFIPGATPTPEVVEEPKPGQAPKKTASVSKPLTPPQGSKPSVHGTAQVYQTPQSVASEPEPEPVPEPQPEPEPEPQPVIPQPPAYEPPVLQPPSPPQIQAPGPPKIQAPTLFRANAIVSPTLTAQGPIPTASLTPTGSLGRPNPGTSSVTSTILPPAPTEPIIYDEANPELLPVQKTRKPIPNSIKVVAAIVLTIVVVLLALFIVGRNRENAEIALFNQMILLAAKEGTTEVPVNKRKLELLLTNASDPTGKEDRSAIYTALALAIPSDNTDVDLEIADYITTKEMHRDIRVVLFREVIAKRKNPKVVQKLVDFAKSATEQQSALAAIEACREVVADPHFETFLELMKNSKDDGMRKAAENNLTNILNKSSSSSLFRTPLVTTYNTSKSDSVRHATLRLLGRIGGDQALDFVKESLKSGDHKTKVAALGALGNWVDSEGFKILIEYISTEANPDNRKLAYNAAIKYAASTEDKPEDAWKKIAEQAKTQEDQISLINALASYSADPWVFEIMNNIVKTSKIPAAVARAKEAIAYLEKMKKNQAENPEDK